MNDTLESVRRSQARNTQRYATCNVSFLRWKLETAESAWMGPFRNRYSLSLGF